MPSNSESIVLLPMNVSIICIGNELLSGRTLNTNATWLGKTLTEIGCIVNKQIVIADDEEPIVKTLNDLIHGNNECVIITGGLGPTSDDITRETLFKYVGLLPYCNSIHTTF